METPTKKDTILTAERVREVMQKSHQENKQKAKVYYTSEFQRIQTEIMDAATKGKENCRVSFPLIKEAWEVIRPHSEKVLMEFFPGMMITTFTDASVDFDWKTRRYLGQ